MTTPATPGAAIEKLDPNFISTEASATSVRWIDAFDATQLALRGLAWLEENRGARSFRRIPERAAAPLSEAVQSLTYYPASAFLSFATDSPSISVRATVRDSAPMLHMPLSGSNGVELYLREGQRWVPFATGIPDLDCTSYERELTSGLPRARREFRLYLPPYRPLEELSIGIETGASIEPIAAPAGQKPIFIYGTSITQGGCANTAGADYVSILGRDLGVETINFGFSGSGKGEPEVAELISEIDAEMFVLDFVANCSAELLVERLAPFIDILRRHRPEVPIVLVSNPQFNGVLLNAQLTQRREVSEARRDHMMSEYCRRRSAGDRRIYYIDGYALLPAGIAGLYVDGVHPTSAGFMQMAARMAEQLTVIRLSLREA